jgi:DNA-binding response OmpR family regulator
MIKNAIVLSRFILACILHLLRIMRKVESNNKAVLIIENDSDLANSIRLYLEDTYSVYVTKDPAQIANYIAQHKVKLILTDIDISSRDLHSHLSRIKASNPEIKIVLMYMFLDEDEVQEQQIFSKADDYIFKPFNADVLRHKLDKLLTVNSKRIVHN